MSQSHYISSDYAGITGQNAQFYYGYERTDENEDWCFVATIQQLLGHTIEEVIPFRQLGAKDMFNVEECLMAGIAIVMTKYRLTQCHT